MLIVTFIYLTRTQLCHSMELWCRRTSLVVCAYFEKFDIAFFKKVPLVLSQLIIG